MNADDQTIFRIAKNPDNPFVMIDKRPLEKPYLSWKAKGLLAYLLSRPDDWTINFGDLINRSTDGEYATRAAAKELEKAGHIKVDQERDNTGKIKRWIYTVFEQPLRGFQDVGNPDVGNRDINNKESTNKESTNTINSKLSPKDRAALEFFTDTFGALLSANEGRRILALKERYNGRLEQAIEWAAKKEIHLENRPGLVDSLETACAGWRDRPERTEKKARRSKQDEHAEFIRKLEAA